MVSYLPKTIFVLFFTLIFLLEGLSFKKGREISYVLILCMPSFLFYLHFMFKNRIKLSPFVGFVSALYIVFVSLSALSSKQINVSIEGVLLTIAVVSLFIYSSYHRDELQNIVLAMIMILSFVFISRHVLYRLIPIDFGGLLTLSAFQFFYSFYPNHNQLGTFLTLPIITCFFYLFFTAPSVKTPTSESFIKKTMSWLLTKKHILLILFYFPFFIFSYSRSSYNSVFWTFILMLFYNRKILFSNNFFSKKKIVFIILFGIIVLLMFFITVEEVKSIPIISSLHVWLQKYAGLGGKSFLSGRFLMFSDMLQRAEGKYLLGLGKPLIYSQSYTLHTNIGWPSHSLIVDIIAKQGLLSFFAFVLLHVVIFVKSDKRSVFFYLWINLFINFLTNWSYTFYSLYCIYFILPGLIPVILSSSTQNKQFIRSFYPID